MSKYNSQSVQKQPIEERPAGVMPLVRGMEEQEVLLPNGTRRKLLVLDSDQEKYKDFSMVFKTREEGLFVDVLALGVFHHLATAVSDQVNVCRVTVEEVARMAHKSKPTVLKAFNQLIEAQYIKRISAGVYLLSPYRTVQVRKRYFPILERAWKTENIDSIRLEMNRLDARTKDDTAKNRRMVQEAGCSAVREAVTLPEVELLPPEERVPYIQQVKREERLLKGIERIQQEK